MKIYYSSDEMFSSTDLIRKSKPIYDALSTKEIDKAVILRDGKPAFILLNFHEYENIMKEYLALKNESKIALPLQQSIKEAKIENPPKSLEQDIDEEEYKKALEEIDNLDLSLEYKESQKAPLKEFWDE